MVSQEKKTIITQAATATEAWKSLADTLNRKDVTSTFHVFNGVLDLNKDGSSTMLDHILTFEAAWNRLVQKQSSVTSVDKKYLQSLKMCTEDIELKAQLLLRTCCQSLPTLFENLSTREHLTYNDIRTRLLDNSALSDGNGNAFFSASKSKKQKGKSSNKRNQQNTNQSLCKGISPSDECSYCWKRLLPSRNHKQTSCSVLTAEREKNNSFSANTGSAKVASASDSNDIKTGYAFMASSATIPADLSSLPPHFAMKASATKLPTVWIFDTGASHHITADISDLTDPVAYCFSITVGGGNVLYSTQKRTVIMSVEIHGRVICLTLSNGEPLFSWNVISPKCHMSPEDFVIEVCMKSNNDLILRAVRNHGLYKFTELINTGHAYMSTAQY
jgi:hypothetical protein